ncbi:MAG: dihydroorotate dehydrogenase [Actinomycetota bacterium]|nr:dihydroorotate dehydrogenase [Actinomycetota bacterium]
MSTEALSLAVDVGGVRLPTPVVVASGCFGPELAQLADVGRFGGVVTKSITMRPHRGTPSPRIAETPSGLLWDTGLQNDGIESFLSRELPALAELGMPVIVSVAGSSIDEFMRLVMALEGAPGIVAIEANACCPSRERDGQWYGASVDGAAEVAGAVSRLARVPVFVKLPESPDLVEVAQACLRAGATGLTLIHSLPGMAVDVGTFQSRLAAVKGSISGPAIHGVALHAVYRVAQAFPEAAIFAAGGVSSAEDAAAFLLAGASAVQVGTAIFRNPQAPIEVAAGLARLLAERGLTSPEQLRGRMGSLRAPAPVGMEAT